MPTVDRTIYVASQSFIVWEGGRRVRFLRGRTTIRAGHPLLEEHRDRFRPLEVVHDWTAPKAEPAPIPARPAQAKAKAEPATAEPATEPEADPAGTD